MTNRETSIGNQALPIQLGFHVLRDQKREIEPGLHEGLFYSHRPECLPPSQIPLTQAPWAPRDTDFFT